MNYAKIRRPFHLSAKHAWALAATAAAAFQGVWIDSATAQTIVAGPVLRSDTQVRYYLTSRTSWHSAQALAEQMNGNLVTINDASENAWIVANMGPLATFGLTFWIGLTDEDQEGTWVWISGDPSTYRNWDGGQPDDHQGIENWAHFHGSARWNDLIEPPGMCTNVPAFGDCSLQGLIEVPCTITPDTKNWTQAAGGSWVESSNWSPSGVPIESSRAVFALPGVYSVLLPQDQQIGVVEIADGEVTFSLDTSSLLPATGCGPSGPFFITSPSSSATTFNLVGGTIQADRTISLAAGSQSTSSFNILGGATVVAGANVLAGSGTNSLVELNITGATLDLQADLWLGAEEGASATLTIGESGEGGSPGRIIGTGSSSIFAGRVAGIPGGARTTGTINLNTGGILTASELVLGQRPLTNGVLNMTGGTLDVDTLVISDQGDGQFNWTGGTVQGLKRLHIGRAAGSEGSLTLNGPGRSLEIAGLDGTAGITVGEHGRGTLRIENGATISLAQGQLQAMGLGTQSDGRAAVVVTGDGSGITGSASETNDNSLLRIGNAYGISGLAGTLVIEDGGSVTFGRVLAGGSITGSGGGISVDGGTLTVRGIDDAFSNPDGGLRVGNATNSAHLTIDGMGTVEATSAIFTGRNGTGPVVDVKGFSDLNVESLYVTGSAETQIRIRDLATLRTSTATVGTSNGNVALSGEVVLEGPGEMWINSGTLYLGSETDPNAIGRITLNNGAELRTDTLYARGSAVITGGLNGNPLIHVGTVRNVPDIQCNTFLFNTTPVLPGTTVVFGVGAGIGGYGTWPGDFNGSGASIIVPSREFNCVPESRSFTIDGNLTLNDESRLWVEMLGYACGCGEYTGALTTSLIVNGTATLGGSTLQLELWERPVTDLCTGSAIRPQNLIGGSFEVVTAMSVSGEFGEVELASDFPTNRFEVVYEPARVVVNVLPPVCETTITGHPEGGIAAPGSSIALSVQAGTDWGELTYEWMAYGLFCSGDECWFAAEAGGPGTGTADPNGNWFTSTGQGTPQLIVTIDPAYFTDPGRPTQFPIQCWVRDVCGQLVTSMDATITLCRADVNQNGSVDVPDIFAFLSAWFAQEAGADFDDDGTIAVPDIFAFLSAWFAGCP